MGEDTVAHVFDEGLRALCIEHAVAILEYRRKHREDDEQQRNIIEMVTEIFKSAERVYNGECPFRQLRRLAAEHTVDGTLIIFGLSVSSRARSRAEIILVTKKPTDPRMKPRVIFIFPRFSALF